MDWVIFCWVIKDLFDEVNLIMGVKWNVDKVIFIYKCLIKNIENIFIV